MIIKIFRTLILVLILIFLISKPVRAQNNVLVIGSDIFYNNDISLFVNNNKINNLHTNPVFYKDYLLVPTREVFEPLGSFITYIDVDKVVYIIYNEKIIGITCDSDIAIIDNKRIKMSVPAKMVNDKLLIPLRSVSELLGLEVNWDGFNNFAYVNEKNTVPKLDDEIKFPDDEIKFPDDEIKCPDDKKTFPDEKTFPDDKTSQNNNTNSTITNIIFPNKNQKQSILIKLNSPLSRLEQSYLNDNRFILDFYNTDSMINNEYDNINIEKILNIRVGIEPADDSIKTRIVFQMNGVSNNISATLSEDRKNILIDFGDSIKKGSTGASGVVYANNVLSIPKRNGISKNDLINFDNYNNNKITFAFNSSLGMEDGYLNINDNYIDSLHIENINNSTCITVNEKLILAPVITEDNQYIYVKFVLPKEKYNKILIIDPGHGGKDPGTINESLLENMLREKDIVLDVSTRLYDIIQKDGNIKTYMTRSDDTFIKLNDRANFSNKLGDMFVSIHVNATTVEPPSGIETLYYENIEVNKKGISSEQLAKNIQKHLIKLTNAKDRGVKTASFVVIKANENPSVLVELGFISNKGEALMLIETDYKQILAEAIYLGILDSFNIYTPKR